MGEEYKVKLCGKSQLKGEMRCVLEFGGASAEIARAAPLPFQALADDMSLLAALAYSGMVMSVSSDYKKGYEQTTDAIHAAVSKIKKALRTMIRAAKAVGHGGGK